MALKRWVDSRLELMRKKDTFMSILKNNVPARFVAGVLEEHPPAEQHVRVRPRGLPERGHRLLAAVDRTTTIRGAAAG